MRAKLLWLLGGLLTALAAVLAFFGFAELQRRREQERQQREAAANFKSKVADIKEQRTAEKVVLAVEVAKVEQKAEADKARDSVDVANELIAQATAEKKA